MSTQIGVSGVTFSDSTVQHTASSITQPFLVGPFSNTYLDFQNLSPYVKKITVIFPFILSGNRAIALALKGVTKCRSVISLRFGEMATATLILSALKGYFERAV